MFFRTPRSTCFGRIAGGLLFLLPAVALTLVAAAGQARAGAGVPPNLAQALQEFRAKPSKESFESILTALPSSLADEDDPTYFVEGDIGLKRAQVCSWVKSVTKIEPPADTGCKAVKPPARLSAPAADGKELRTYFCEMAGERKPCVWTLAERRDMKFAFDAKSFSFLSQKQFKQFKDEVIAAAQDWTSACKPPTVCMLSMTYKEGGDSLPDPLAAGYMFVVRFDPLLPCGVNGQAFFRNMPAKERVLRVGTEFFGYRQPLSKDPQQLWLANWRHTLRHEMGHILGYGHEQYANALKQPICKREGDDKSISSWDYDNTDYDKLSIMHSSYCFSQADFLKKAGPKTGVLSEEDKEQHTRYYDIDKAPR